MMKQFNGEASPVAERIASVASNLFYRQGYRATGVNEVIRKAEVAKATFYNHFGSKDDLYLSCLKRTHRLEHWYLEGAIAAAKTPLEKLMAPLESISSWLINNEYRGCAFIHAVTEVPDDKSPIRQEGKLWYDFLAKRIEELTENLLASDPKAYQHIQPDAFAQHYFLAYSGAIMLSGLYHEVAPIAKAALEIRERLNTPH